jgi:hypothetical protein
MTVPSKPLYALLALGMPFSLLCAALLIGTSLFPLSLSIPLVLLQALLAGVGAQVYCELMKGTKSARSAADLRGASAALIISYALASISRVHSNGMLAFFPNVMNVTAAAGALYVWIAVVALKKVFAARELFISYTEQYKGEALQQAMHDCADLLITYNTALLRTGRVYAFKLFCLVILAVIKPVETPILCFLSVLVIGAAFVFGLFRTFSYEHYCAGRGIAVPPADRAQRIGIIAICAFVTAAAALLLGSSKNLLPVSLLIGLVLWLLSLLPSLDFLPEDLQMQIQESIYLPEQPNLVPFEMVENAEPWKGWEYIKHGFIVLLVAAFIWFMVKPLFARYPAFKGGAPFARKIRDAVLHWFGSCAQALKDFLGLLRQSKPSSRISDDTVQRISVSLEQAYSGARKKALKGSLTLFARLIAWGTAFVAWKPSYPPAYYCALVAAQAPDQAQAVIQCGALFEKALYSAQRLSQEEQALFRRLIDEITGA